jgi:hypothetical protein
MKSKIKESSSFFLIYVFLILLVILILIGIMIYIFYPRNIIDNCPKNHVCLPQKTFNDVILSKNEVDLQSSRSNINSIKIIETRQQNPIEDITVSRDRRVLNDPLFPPLNRTDRVTFDGVAYETKERNINIPTNNIGDRFRQIGYLSAVSQEGEKDAGGGSWKLMGREKNRNESEFYMIPTNNNYDIKVPLTPEVIIGPRLRDIYSIPNQLSFKSPLLGRGPYEFVELPKTDFADSYYL